MCVIIVKKQGVELPKYELLKRAYKCNSDGCGYVTLNNSKIHCYKSLNFNDFYKDFKANVNVESETIIHFRLATHGSKNVNNCHPFANADKSIYFAHNGVLPIESTNDQTDSQILFNSILLGAIDIYGLRSHNFEKVVKATICTSKFAFLDSKGIVTFGNYLNYKGLLFSNSRCLPTENFGFNYRSDEFYNKIFSEHNSVYLNSKFCF